MKQTPPNPVFLGKIEEINREDMVRDDDLSLGIGVPVLLFGGIRKACARRCVTKVELIQKSGLSAAKAS